MIDRRFMYGINHDKTTNSWYVFESNRWKDDPAPIIKSNLTKKEAVDLERNLNKGYGFNGWTPSFFLQDFNLTPD